MKPIDDRNPLKVSKTWNNQEDIKVSQAQEDQGQHQLLYLEQIVNTLE